MTRCTPKSNRCPGGMGGDGISVEQRAELTFHRAPSQPRKNDGAYALIGRGKADPSPVRLENRLSHRFSFLFLLDHLDLQIDVHVVAHDQPAGVEGRSEERRVGKEGRSRWSPYH